MVLISQYTRTYRLLNRTFGDDTAGQKKNEFGSTKLIIMYFFKSIKIKLKLSSNKTTTKKRKQIPRGC